MDEPDVPDHAAGRIAKFKEVDCGPLADRSVTVVTVRSPRQEPPEPGMAARWFHVGHGGTNHRAVRCQRDAPAFWNPQTFRDVTTQKVRLSQWQLLPMSSQVCEWDGWMSQEGDNAFKQSNCGAVSPGGWRVGMGGW